jgi:hypothetical protein
MTVALNDGNYQTKPYSSCFADINFVIVTERVELLAVFQA